MKRKCSTSLERHKLKLYYTRYYGKTLEEDFLSGGDLPDAKEQPETIRMQIARGLLVNTGTCGQQVFRGGLAHLPTGGQAFYREEQKTSLQKQKRGYRNEAGA